jgi:hypothetical protein
LEWADFSVVANRHLPVPTGEMTGCTGNWEIRWPLGLFFIFRVIDSLKVIKAKRLSISIAIATRIADSWLVSGGLAPS